MCIRDRSSGAGQINSAVSQLNQTTQQNASSSEQLASTSEEMSSQAEQLQQTMAFFQLPGGHRAQTPVARRNPGVSKAPLITQIQTRSNGNGGVSARLPKGDVDESKFSRF